MSKYINISGNSIQFDDRAYINQPIEIIEYITTLQKYKDNWEALLGVLINRFNVEQDTKYLDIVELMRKIDKGDSNE